MTIAEYQKYNNQFREKYIYRLGGWTGFFSEYNNMVLAIFYCIVNRKQFVLQSRNANFSSGKGWTEFFLPFCDEVWDEYLERYNYREKPSYQSQWDKILSPLYRLTHFNYYYTYEFFDNMREIFLSPDTIYNIPELSLHGSLQECCSTIHQAIWNYNTETKQTIETLIAKLHMPSIYASVHIRQGDKKNEADLYDATCYMHMLQKHSPIEKLFVLTDDYNVIKTLRLNYPSYAFYTLCQEDETGYDFEILSKMEDASKRAALLRLWASMDVMQNSHFFVGTYSANPGMNMGFRMSACKMAGLDYDQWQVW